ncbi:MAG: RDD family protein [Holophagales bacterium]|nr:MAG: RDD family protein [Holophagales bacterium]
MNHTPSSPDEPSLFDLPLQSADETTEETGVEELQRPSRRGTRRGATRETLPLFQAESVAPESRPTVPFPLERLPQAPPAEPADWPRLARGARDRSAEEQEATEASLDGHVATVASRFKAATADGMLLVAVLALLPIGAMRLGAAVRWSDWPAYLAFVAAFSFLYSVISLAFWGQTPGMVWAGIVARSEDAEPLAFGQTARRWLGSLLTLALAGLPGLLALGGRSLADRLSGSLTLPVDSAAS